MSDTIVSEPSHQAAAWSSASLPRFGVVVDGVQLLLPSGIACDFIVRPALFGLPMAPSRMLGLVQARGYALPVFDPRLQRQATDKMRLPEAILVLGQGQQAGAMLIDSPPRLLKVVQDLALKQDDNLTAEKLRQGFPLGHPIFNVVLPEAVLASPADSDDQASLWWRLHPRTLFEQLTRTA